MRNKLTAIIGVIFAMTVINTQASVVSFAQSMADAGNLTLSISPAYAPDVKDAKGDPSPWGIGVAATYTFEGALGQYAFTGLRFDYLGGDYFAPSISGGLKADVRLFDAVTVTPLAYTGAVFPLSDWKEQAGSSVGLIAGAGAVVTVWQSEVKGYDVRLRAGGAVEKWMMNDAASRFDGQIYRGFVAVTLTKAKLKP